MALNGSTLGTAIASAVTGLSAEDKSDPEKIWQEVATAIVNHFKTNAVISCTVPASSIVTTGSAATQTGPAAPVAITGTIQS